MCAPALPVPHTRPAGRSVRMTTRARVVAAGVLGGAVGVLTQAPVGASRRAALEALLEASWTGGEVLVVALVVSHVLRSSAAAAAAAAPAVQLFCRVASICLLASQLAACGIPLVPVLLGCVVGGAEAVRGAWLAAAADAARAAWPGLCVVAGALAVTGPYAVLALPLVTVMVALRLYGVH